MSSIGVRRVLSACVLVAAMTAVHAQEGASGAGSPAITVVVPADAGITRAQTVPGSPGSNTVTPTCGRSAGCGNMTFRGTSGEMNAVQHSQKVFTIFWNPSGTSFPSGYLSTNNQFVQDLNGSGYYGIASQYGDSAGKISSNVTYGGTWTDTVNALPSPLTSSDLAAEVARAKTAKGWSSDDNSYFQVYTPPGISENGVCGYHTYSSSVGAYGVIFYPIDLCTFPSPWPNGQYIDAAISVSAHEILETLTDPRFDGWLYQDSTGEIGDLCAWIFGTRDSSGANVTLNGHKYTVQQEWSNADSGCVITFAGIPSSSCGTTGASVVAKPASASSGVPAGGVWSHTLRPGGETWRYTFTVGDHAQAAPANGSGESRAATPPASRAASQGSASGDAMQVPGGDLNLPPSTGPAFVPRAVSGDDFSRVQQFDQNSLSGMAVAGSGDAAAAGYETSIARLGAAVPLDGGSGLSVYETLLPAVRAGQELTSVTLHVNVEHPDSAQLRIWLVNEQSSFLLWDGARGGTRNGSALTIDRTLTKELANKTLTGRWDIYIADRSHAVNAQLKQAWMAATSAPPAASLPGGNSDFATLDIGALRAYLRTASGGAGNEVVPTIGQTVYLHGDYQVTGSGSAVTVYQRALLDGSVFCSFGGSGTPGYWYTGWCNAGWAATAGTHTLEWDYDYTNTVAETNEFNNSAYDTFTSDGLDIAANRAYLRTASGGGGSEVSAPSVGQTVYLHGDYQVNGTGNAVTVNQRALLDGSVFCSFGGGGTPGYAYTGWCNAGWTATAGSHTLEWDYDYTNSIAETNESNNSAYTSFSGAGLDIAAIRAYFRTASGGGGSEVDAPAVGQSVYLHGDYQVTGSGSSVTVNQRALLDGSVFCSFGGGGTPGTAYTGWCNSAWTATAGSHTLEWDYDYTNSIPESNENNNSAFKSFTAAGLDIAAQRSYLRTQPGAAGSEVSAPQAGQTVYFHGDYQLTGTGNTVTVNQRALLDGSVFCSFGGDSTPGFAYTGWCNSGWTATSGTHTLKWDYDYTQTIAETNENNNSVSASFTTSGTTSIDIVAQRAYLKTAASGGGTEVSQPSPGQSVYLYGDYQLTGSGNAVNVSERALLDGNVFCSCSNSSTPGSSYSAWCSQSWTATSGAHTLSWDFDYTNSVTESNENNNSVSQSFSGAALSAPVSLAATAISSTSIGLTWNAVAGAAGYQVYRSSGNGAYALAGTPQTNGFTNAGLAANTTYLYKVLAVDAANVQGPFSNVDLATTILFTDDPLGVHFTLIKATHINELRTSVNAVRAAAGLPPVSFTDTIAYGVNVKAVHITELRSALDAALSALGIPLLPYTNPLTQRVTPVRAIDVTEIRNRVK